MTTEPYRVIIDSDVENPFIQVRLEKIKIETQNMYKRQAITMLFGITISAIILYNSKDDFKYIKVGVVCVLTIGAVIVEYKLSNIDDM
jgi:hypothetical protein